MERKAGFKECPKCGLRNKPTAVQCDFCGQSLTAGDDWQSHVKDLESFTNVDGREQVDDRTSRRIESTKIRKEPPHHRPLEVKEVANLEDILKEFDQISPVKEEPKEEPPKEIQVSTGVPDEPKVAIEAVPATPEIAPKVEETPTEPSDASEPVSEPPVEKPATAESPIAKPDKAPEEELPVEVAPQVPEPEKETPATPAEPVTVISAESETDKPTETVSVVWDEVVVVGDAGIKTAEDGASQTAEGQTKSKGPFDKDIKMAIGILAVGIFLYMVTLALTAIGTVGTVIGLGLGAISSLMIIIGVAMAHHSLRRKNTGEVYICPKCHESVDRDGDTCPACGATFLPED